MSSRRPSSAPEGAVSELEAHLGFWLRFVSNHVSDRFRRLVEERGVTVSEWVALRTLYASDSSSARALVESLGMTKGAVSKVLDRLERKKLVRRVADPDDGRAQRIALTAAGRKLVPALATLADENDAHFFGQLAPVARRALAETLRELVRTHQLSEVPTE
ncbi:MAG: MarR family winged helix-turn-helix transcriptional regulator [Polyangiaceae bacterium]